MIRLSVTFVVDMALQTTTNKDNRVRFTCGNRVGLPSNTAASGNKPRSTGFELNILLLSYNHWIPTDHLFQFAKQNLYIVWFSTQCNVSVKRSMLYNFFFLMKPKCHGLSGKFKDFLSGIYPYFKNHIFWMLERFCNDVKTELDVILNESLFRKSCGSTVI